MKKSAKLAIGLGVAAVALPAFALAPGHVSRTRKAPFKGRNFAHRGLHTVDKSVPENSLAAFARAAEAGYGMELDVRLTRDGMVVVFHDDTLDRVCGVDKRVDELTYGELCDLRLCGTEEGIPLFDQVLDLVDGRVPLIVELKTGRRNRDLCRKTLALLQSYPGHACIESFDPFIVAWFRFHAPKLLRGQLAAPKSEYRDRPGIQGFLLSHTLLNFIARPQFIAYKIGPMPLAVQIAQVLGKLSGAMKVAWTSHNTVNEKGRDAVIFEFYRPLPYFR